MQFIAKGKLEMRNISTDDDDAMEVMNGEDICSYFGHMQAKQIKHVRIKQKLDEEHIKSQKKHIEDKIEQNKYDKSINIYATPVLNFRFRIVKWAPTDLENAQTKMRTLLTRYNFTTHVLQRKDLLYHGKWVAENWLI